MIRNSLGTTEKIVQTIKNQEITVTVRGREVVVSLLGIYGIIQILHSSFLRLSISFQYRLMFLHQLPGVQSKSDHVRVKV